MLLVCYLEKSFTYVHLAFLLGYSATLGALDNVSLGAVDLPSWPSRAITSPDSRTAVSTCFSTGAIDLTVAWGRVGEAGLEHQPRMSATQRDIFNDTARLIQEYRGELLLRRDSVSSDYWSINRFI